MFESLQVLLLKRTLYSLIIPANVTNNNVNCYFCFTPIITLQMAGDAIVRHVLKPCARRLSRAGCGFPYLRGGCGNPRSYACGCGLNMVRREPVVKRCRAALPAEMFHWAKNYVIIFVRAAHWMAYFHFSKQIRFVLKLLQAFEYHWSGTVLGSVGPRQWWV